MESNIRFIKSVSKINPLPIAAINSKDDIKLIYSNGLAEKILGYPSEELFQLSRENFKQIIHHDDYEKLLDNIKNILSSEEGEIITFHFRIKKRSQFFIKQKKQRDIRLPKTLEATGYGCWPKEYLCEILMKSRDLPLNSRRI